MGEPATYPLEPRQTAGEEVYRSFRSDLITLVHRPGTWLTEHELARRYGTSRVPVREACRRLQQEGLLTAVPYKGFYVAPISVKEISDSFDLRELLEVHAVELAASRATDAEVDRLAALASAQYTHDDRSSYAEFLAANLEFHGELARLSGNDRLVSTLGALLASMQRYFFLGLDLGDFGAEMRDEHEELLTALRRRDGVSAVDCVRRQIRRSRGRIVRALLEQRTRLPLE